MLYKIHTFGCQQNIADSAQIETTLQKQGYTKASTQKEANLVVVNACSVRKSATDRAYAKIRQAKKAGQKVILAGCVTKHDRDNMAKLVDEIWDPKDYFCTHQYQQNDFQAFIPIMTGCNNFCSYCVVPYVRGREKSRPVTKIIADVKKALQNGAREIILLGQNVNSYRYQTRNQKSEIRNKNQKTNHKSKTTNFPDLLKQINSLPGHFWLTFTSNHPKDISDQLITTMAQCQKISPLVHLPIQSGNNNVLKKMNRRYTAGQYKQLVKKIRTAFKKYRPDDLPLSLSTDFIVGFPGETNKQFSDSAKLIKEIGFDMAYLNCYSARPGTVAAKLPDNVPYTEKRARENKLNETLKKTALQKNKYYLNKTVDVLIADVKDGYGFGLTKTHKNVKAKIQDKTKPGDIVKIKIDKVSPWRLFGQKTKPKLIVIVGPNAAGKTSLSIRLAQKFNGEVISADSRQVYQYLDIGSGKATKKEMRGVPHYLLDVCHPKKIYTVAHFKKDTSDALAQIYGKNKIPLLVGGTGFFVDAVAQNLEIPQVKPNKKLRLELEKKSAKQLFDQLKKLDSARAENIDSQNKRRLIRAIEIAKSLGHVPPAKTDSPFDVLYLGVWREKDELKERIHIRLLQRIKEGMIKEVKNLRRLGISWQRLDDLGLEYRYISFYLKGRLDYEEMLDELERAIWRFAKRQWTWFKRNKDIHWIKDPKQAEKLVRNFLSD